MYINKKKLKDGTYYYSFSYDDPISGKRIRLKKDQHPHFTDGDEARSWANSQEAYRESRKAAIERKLSWRTKYYDFEKTLIPKFRGYQKDRAPNSWKSDVYLLEHYCLPWFLEEKHASNINDWHLLFIDFKDYLKDSAKTTRGRPVSVSLLNGSIKALNNFLSCLKEYSLIDPDAAKKKVDVTRTPGKTPRIGVDY